MVHAALHPATELPDLLTAIESDGFSWQGISLYYLLPVAGMPMEAACFSTGSLLFRTHGEAIIYVGEALGDIPASIRVIAEIPDIALAAAQAVAIVKSETQRPAAQASASAKPAKPLSVLLVEDDPMTRKLAENFLGNYVKAVAVENARSAAANYAVHEPDMVFLDLHYQGDNNDGFDVLKNILAFNPAAHIIIFSGNAQAATIYKALCGGARGFIPKPFRAQHFMHYIDAFRA